MGESLSYQADLHYRAGCQIPSYSLGNPLSHNPAGSHSALELKYGANKLIHVDKCTRLCELLEIKSLEICVPSV